MNSPHLEKQAMRQTFRQRRAGLSSDVKDKADAEIAEHIGKLLIKSPNRRIAAYLASPQEVDLLPWFEIAWAAGQQVYVPVLSEIPGHMAFYCIGPKTPLQQGRFKLMEPSISASDIPATPSDLDVALIPLLAFDGQGHRLGMGGGYYDRYFAQAKHRPLMIGVGYQLQQAEHILPTEPWDINLSGVVTETGVRLFHS